MQIAENVKNTPNNSSEYCRLKIGVIPKTIACAITEPEVSVFLSFLFFL